MSHKRSKVCRWRAGDPNKRRITQSRTSLPAHIPAQALEKLGLASEYQLEQQVNELFGPKNVSGLSLPPNDYFEFWEGASTQSAATKLLIKLIDRLKTTEEQAVKARSKSGFCILEHPVAARAIYRASRMGN